VDFAVSISIMADQNILIVFLLPMPNKKRWQIMQPASVFK